MMWLTNEDPMPERPPRDIVPSLFFEKWLPELFHAEFVGSRRAAADIHVRIQLSGESGGVWDLTIAKGRLTVGEQAAGEPAVTVTQSVADWRAFAAGEEGATDLAPPQASPLDLLFVDAASRQVLATVRGTLRFEVTGYHGRTWGMLVKFGTDPAPPSPNATITTDAETWSRLLARTMAPPEAYFSGKIKMTGDTGLAMQLAMGMMPRFTG